jgi:hypothetical protein
VITASTHRRTCLSMCGLLAVVLAVRASGAQSSGAPTGAVPQPLADAWWTGPMLTPSAGTLPPGHFLIEPYLYDVAAAHANAFGSRSYVIYGLVNRLSVGLIPTFGFNTVSGGPSSSRVGLGDITLLGQYRLSQFHTGSWVPTTSVILEETLPTGQYDRLGDRSTDGFGSGAFTTTAGLYSQTYFWLPNGRILRMRFNVTLAFSGGVGVDGASVYGTEAGFHGHATPGSSSSLDGSWEYSLTRSWVLAFDATYSEGGNTRVTGYGALDPAIPQNSSRIELNTGTSGAFAFAPAVEYSWKPSIGVLLGVRLIPRDRNTSPTISPALAINMVY